ncbi:MAG: hypothetical protein MJA30_18780 [Cytophagales bacterium]|nr:hypothetical protein [Cytophagales bacterium]
MRSLMLFCLIGCLISFQGYGQSKGGKSIERSNSFEPYSPKEERALVKQQKKSKKKKTSFSSMFNKRMDGKIKEYEKRMQANAKMDKKAARQMQKPQYSDPSYFGHKKKPKKRPVGKRKFCKVCGIVH